MKLVLSLVLNECINDSRVIKTGRSLISAGYDVTILALHAPGLALEETIDGVKVHRIKLSSKRLPSNRIIQAFKYLELIIRIAFKYRTRADYVHCNDLNTLPLGAILKVVSNNDIKIVYDAHEYEIEKNGVSGAYKKLLRFCEKLLIRECESIITVSNKIAEEYKRLYQIKKPWVVLNCPPKFYKSKKDIFRAKFNLLETQKIFLYQGSLNPGRGVEVLLEAFSSFESDELVLIFMGYGSLVSTICERQSKNIFYHSAVPSNTLLEHTASADFGIAFVEDSCLSYRYCLPNKLFEYLMADLPVITSNLPEMRRVVEDYGVGVVSEDNSLTGLLDAIQKLVSSDRISLTQNISKTHEVFSWENQEKTLLRAYHNA